MSKILFFLFLWSIPGGIFARNAGMFSYDTPYVNRALATVNVLDRYLEKQPMGLEQLKRDAGFFAEVLFGKKSDAAGKDIENLYFWGSAALTFGTSLLMGCVGWFVGAAGALLIYLMIDDPDKKKDVVLGCITGSLIGVGCSLYLGGVLVDSIVLSPY